MVRRLVQRCELRMLTGLAAFEGEPSRGIMLRFWRISANKENSLSATQLQDVTWEAEMEMFALCGGLWACTTQSGIDVLRWEESSPGAIVAARMAIDINVSFVSPNFYLQWAEHVCSCLEILEPCMHILPEDRIAVVERDRAAIYAIPEFHVIRTAADLASVPPIMLWQGSTGPFVHPSFGPPFPSRRTGLDGSVEVTWLEGSGLHVINIPSDATVPPSQSFHPIKGFADGLGSTSSAFGFSRGVWVHEGKPLRVDALALDPSTNLCRRSNIMLDVGCWNGGSSNLIERVLFDEISCRLVIRWPQQSGPKRYLVLDCE